MKQPRSTSGRQGLPTIGLRLAALLALVLAAIWVSHLVREALDLTVTPENEQKVHRMIMLGAVVYVVLLAIPFVPGAEIGLAMLTAFGAPIVPLVYLATVTAMMLSYAVGSLLPITTLARLLAFLRLRRAAGLVKRTALMSADARLAMLLEGAPSRTIEFALCHRYLALALAVNLPGNALIGGGGGIMMVAGLSGILAPFQTFLTVAIAVSPVPLVVLLWGG